MPAENSEHDAAGADSAPAVADGADGADGAAVAAVAATRVASVADEALELLAGMVAVIEQTSVAAVRSFDRGGLVRFWNQACSDLYGIGAADALGRPIDQLLSHGAAQADYAAALARVWSSGRPCHAREWKVYSASGAAVWIHSTMFPVFRGGHVQQVFCMDVDITTRKQQESALLAVGGNFAQLFTRSADAIMLLRDGVIAEINPAAGQLFGYADTGGMVGQRLTDFSPLRQPGGELSAELDAAMAQRALGEGNCRYEWHYVKGNGGLFWAEVLLTSVTFDHEFLFYAVLRDVSGRKAAQRSLHLAAQVFEHGREAILVADAEQRIIAVNRAFSRLTGFGAADMSGQRLEVYRGEQPDPLLYQQIWDEVMLSDHWQGEIGARRKGDGVYPAWLALTAIRDSNGAVNNYMGILSDITDRKRSEEHTRHLAEHDFLTDLPNRVLLLDRLSLALVAARRKHTMLAILFLDLDRFKQINDSMGHDVGDQLLKEVARRLIRCVRGVDTVSRQGGDEFLIILADIGGVDQAAHVASSVLHSVSQPYRIGEAELQVSTSIGVSVFPNDGDDIDTLVKNADIAMYHAKESGRNSFQFFNADMNAHIVERVNFENGLRRALDQGEFELEFQPAIDIRSGQVVGAEALIRWRHPELGLLKPERFIGIAEESGLMIPIGNWVLRHACRAAGRWQSAGQPMVVAVNLSAAQFAQKSLPQQVGEALAAAGLAPALLELEITEAILMKGGAALQATLAELRGLGVRLTIDDFGTGYSQLGQLSHYPIDKLKIDQSFMADINADPDHGATIKAIIAVAGSMKMRVIAEGVETVDQLDFLRDQGCDEYQGYYASAALADSELGRLLLH